MGYGPDWTTIPSYLQAHLRTNRIKNRPVRVYNFGRGAYFSTQERILFQQLLLQKRFPDLAIFLDGLNDSYSSDGRPFEWQVVQAVFLGFMNGAPDRTLTDKIMDRVMWSPMARAAKVIVDRYSRNDPALPTATPKPLSRDDIDAVIERYIGNKRQVEGISCAYGIRSLFVWQPVPAYKYDLKYHIALNPIYGLGEHAHSGQTYPVAAERRADFGTSFLWLADIQADLKEPLYMDAVHYTAKFSELIAAKIATFVLEESDSPQACGQ